MGKVFALVDCNNYYVSVERLFNPKLRNVPVVVCGNLDRWGCIISRSEEAKALGIEMAQPAFQIEDLIRRNNVRVCASNYTLYADIHQRIGAVMERYSPTVYDYSIDEYFLDLTGIAGSLPHLGQKIRDDVFKVGIPTAVGIAPTKLLAKLASKLAKTSPTGVRELMDEHDIDRVLEETPLTKLWGVAGRLEKRLYRLGIKTPLHLKNYNDDVILKQFGIVMLRIVHELRGISCIPLDAIISKEHKQYMCSRSFGAYVDTRDEVASHVARFTSSAAERMRGQNQMAGSILVFLMTNHHNHSHKQYRNSVSVTLSSPTAHTSRLIEAALKGLDHIFRDGYHYKKAGIMLMDLCRLQECQGSLFDNEDKSETKRLMNAIDAINYSYGKSAVYYASARDRSKAWGTRPNDILRSKRYTTNWGELLSVGR